MEDLKHWVAFTRVPSIGTARVRLMERVFGTLGEAWRAPLSALEAAGLDRSVLRQVSAKRPLVDPDDEMAKLERAGVRAITWHDAEYPDTLKEIFNPPPVLFLKGVIEDGDRRAVAVVGTRRTTAYGREACATLVRELAWAGVTIVSGLARGIDGIAHRAALDAGGRTVAIMGSGVDVVYPPEHAALAQQAAESGALVSEHPLGTRPNAQNFPRRNRLLSGFSLGVLVVEAAYDSGAMWTVRHAVDQNRDVFAVPGSIYSPGSRGPNRLIQDGAKLVLDHTDILQELNLSTVERQAALPGLGEAMPLTQGDTGILSFIGQEPVHIDEVVRDAGLPIAAVSGALAVLELAGAVRQVGAMHYVRVREAQAAYGQVQ
jgi:DNA processing protein